MLVRVRTKHAEYESTVGMLLVIIGVIGLAVCEIITIIKHLSE